MFNGRSIRRLIRRFKVNCQRPRVRCAKDSIGRRSTTQCFFLILMGTMGVLIRGGDGVPTQCVLRLHTIGVARESSFVLLRLCFRVICCRYRFTFLSPCGLVRAAVIASSPIYIGHFDRCRHFLREYVMYMVRRNWAILYVSFY